MTINQDNIRELIERLYKHALPDPHDEREVLHAPLLREAADALESLLQAPQDDGITHADDCYKWGPKHHACALAKIEALEKENADVWEKLNLMHDRVLIAEEKAEALK